MRLYLEKVKSQLQSNAVKRKVIPVSIRYCLLTEHHGSEFNPFQHNITFHIKTSHFICSANHMAGFYMKCNTGLNWVNPIDKCLIANT